MIVSIPVEDLWWLVPIIAFDAVLKAIALWKAGRHNQMCWFIGMFPFTTMGILPIVYLLCFQKKPRHHK